MSTRYYFILLHTCDNLAVNSNSPTVDFEMSEPKAFTCVIPNQLRLHTINISRKFRVCCNVHYKKKNYRPAGHPVFL